MVAWRISLKLKVFGIWMHYKVFRSNNLTDVPHAWMIAKPAASKSWSAYFHGFSVFSRGCYLLTFCKLDEWVDSWIKQFMGSQTHCQFPSKWILNCRFNGSIVWVLISGCHLPGAFRHPEIRPWRFGLVLARPKNVVSEYGHVRTNLLRTNMS